MDQRLKHGRTLVFLFHRVALMYITHSKSIYANEDLIFVLLQKMRTRGVKRASRNSIILGSRMSTLQTFPVDED